MTDQEIESYKMSNEPTKISTDKVGRWKKREWKLENGGKIIEHYKYDTQDDNKIKNNKDARKHRNCFNIETIIKDSEDE